MQHLPKLYLVALLIACPTLAADDGHPISMWQIDGPDNSIYLLGSIHMLRASDHPIPAAIYAAYADADALIMELDMDDIDPVTEQALATELGLIQDGRELHDLMGPELYAEAIATEGSMARISFCICRSIVGSPSWAARNVTAGAYRSST